MFDSDLADFISSVSGDDQLAVEENLGDGFVRLRTAEAERRQAKHDIRSVEDIVIEMLRNARDAHAHSIYVATVRDENEKRLVFIDDGDGVPDHMREAIF
ncbi:MAG: ATP-binding protein, partial [Coriobacteriaceae bacterium]|nr:ATP-binding protein [Coriobacteriaceae bacterium]